MKTGIIWIALSKWVSVRTIKTRFSDYAYIKTNWRMVQMLSNNNFSFFFSQGLIIISSSWYSSLRRDKRVDHSEKKKEVRRIYGLIYVTKISLNLGT